MSELTPEELKIIAEGMGYKVADITDGKLIVTYKKAAFEYNPLTNDTQCMEIMVRCGISIAVDSTGDGRQATVWDSDIYFYELYDRANNEPGFEEEELAMVRRLICRAALEYFKK